MSFGIFIIGIIENIVVRGGVSFFIIFVFKKDS